MQRLNKYITDAGYCSRREADAYIEQGRVTVNGREASLGDMVEEGDRIEVDGERVAQRRRPAIYIACNKPVGVTCTSERSDPTNIIDFIGYKERIFPIGRLDKDSEGLILLTSDGDIVNKILRAGNNNPKEYIVTVDRPMTGEFLTRMAAGVNILGVKTKPCKIVRRGETTFVIYLTQGLNRQIRRMCQTLGYKVVRLKRVKVINVALGNLEPGRWRYLTPQETSEMHTLLAHASGTEEASDQRKAPRSPAQHRKRDSAFVKPETSTGVRSSSKSASETTRTTHRPTAKPNIKPDKPASKSGGARVSAKSVSKPTGAGPRPSAKSTSKPAGERISAKSVSKPTGAGPRPSAKSTSKAAGPGTAAKSGAARQPVKSAGKAPQSAARHRRK